MVISKSRILRIIREVAEQTPGANLDKAYGRNAMSRPNYATDLDLESSEMTIEALQDQLADAHARIEELEQELYFIRTECGL